MEELKAFFNSPLPVEAQMIKLRGPLTNGRRITEHNTIYELDKREDHRNASVMHGLDYVEKARQNETEWYLEHCQARANNVSQNRPGGLESLEQLSCMGSLSELPSGGVSLNTVYDPNMFQGNEDKNDLPINEYKDEILMKLKEFKVIIIEGPTGCGKTTQVPQWILEDCYKNKNSCKIVVTQPRRIAAISIAKRVAQERGCDLGGAVGYQVGLDNTTQQNTLINYVTTGVLLQKLVATKTLSEYTHVILDEVHERGQEMDFLLLVVRRLLYTVSSHVKVVLMSATFDKMAFANYFAVGDLKFVAPYIEVKKASTFSVKTYYLNHLMKLGPLTDKVAARTDPGIDPEMYNVVIKLINVFEKIDITEDEFNDPDEADLPSVLVFLPGIHEIEDLYACLNDINLRKKECGQDYVQRKWMVFPLHSSITSEEQARVFQRMPPGVRKIILATNIAESSITVPDIKYVIDFCLIKVLEADPETQFTTLKLHWASKTNCEQRKGRAGRIRDGRVYRLVPTTLYETFSQESSPEMVRCSLERLVLLAKTLDMGSPSDVLALAMEPPNMSNIHRTILVLKEIGALKKTLCEDWCPIDGDMTYMGRIMASLPLDVRASKVIVLGYIYGLLEECIIIAAAMSIKNMFSSPFRERLNAYNSKLTWADGSTSDCIAFYNVYRVWSHLKQTHYFKKEGHSEVAWARSFFIQLRAMKELNDLVREIKHRLAKNGIEVLDKSQSPWTKSETTLALKLILAGAFYPQYYVLSSQDEAREREAVRQLGGHDPRDTVFLKDFPEKQPGEIYSTVIKKIVRQQIGDEPQVIFDTNSRKVFLKFPETDTSKSNKTGDPTIPGQVVLPVYKAIKARQLNLPIMMPLLSEEKANVLMTALKMERVNLNLDQAVPRLPELDDAHIPLRISHVISAGKFWAQYDDESTVAELRLIHAQLNRGGLLAATALRLGQLYAAPYSDAAGTAIYRVRLAHSHPNDMYEVQYIDYGGSGRVHAGSLRELPRGACTETPPLAMQCVLAEVAPSPLLDQHAKWTKAAQQEFDALVNNRRLYAKVYSVVRGVVSVELMVEGQLNVNQELVKRGFAVPSEESYESKMNHDLRLTAHDLSLAQKRAHNREQAQLAAAELETPPAPRPSDCWTSVRLPGPYSPLEKSLDNLMYGSREKSICIEGNSVNSVLLDTNPQEVYKRLMVAGEVGASESSARLTLRHTTLMPNIPGLPAIVALIFCPTAELRSDATRTRYVAALCGLGSTAAGAPHFPEHDLLVDIDADFDVDDIGVINHIRHLMDHLLYQKDVLQNAELEDQFRVRVPRLIRQDIMTLLRKRRAHQPCEAVVGAWEWRSTEDEDVMEVMAENMLEGQVVWPMLLPLELRAPDPKLKLALKRDNDNLKMMLARTGKAALEAVCRLCGTHPLEPQAMRLHLQSTAHRQRELDIFGDNA